MHSAPSPEFSEEDLQTYERLYPEIRAAAFSEAADQRQEQMLSAYIHAAALLFGPQRRYYRDIAPAFFTWMDQMVPPAAPLKSFLEACLNGDALLTDIDDYTQGIADKEQLRARLGMAESEFEAWQRCGNTVLRDILFCRMNEQPFEHLTDEEKIAARSYDPKDIDRLKKQK